VDAALVAILEQRQTAGIPLAMAEAASVAGRHAARVGRFEEARTHLEEARAFYAAEGDEVELLTVDARLVECLVLQGAGTDGLQLASDALERADKMPGVSVIAANLHRLRGWGYIQSGQLLEARGALEESLRLARLEDENLGIKSADYEIALTLGALVRLGELTGQRSDELEAERDAILDRLGVVKVPEPPLPHY
jgi:tetratricopeptide (TPR) repeat protein